MGPDINFELHTEHQGQLPPNKRLTLPSAAEEGRIAYEPAAFDIRCPSGPPCAA